ncbi:holo-ACP synthase [Candidatus Magnetomonas plexicatena]|uniref:holo-ACP synthase n=1 Tax=Candidatus Magnetomonas plexicatena TaxID=2552947 RepID=UPI001C777557|nr:holo-[acyl-carrier-protein] synthase [Nitrospirales bacterium LBB_01]
MIFGIGVDIIINQRIRKAFEKWGDRFLTRIYTKTERDYCVRHSFSETSLAARFAAKEAFIKAAGVFFPFTLIEVCNDKLGKPYILLYGGADDFVRQHGVSHIHLSISHESTHSVALVVLESQEVKRQ